MRRLVSFIGLVVIGVTVGLAIWLSRQTHVSREIVLYGNVDLRQVELPFNNSERIREILVEEGDRVSQGQVVARLDTSRLEPLARQAEALVEAQQRIVAKLESGSRPQEIEQAKALATALRHVVDKLRTGSRPEEIAQAEANLRFAAAERDNTQHKFQRVKSLLETRAVSQEEFDNASAALKTAEARLSVTQKALELVRAGPRHEDVAEAESRLAAQEQLLSLVIAGPRQEEIDEAKARLAAAQAQWMALRQQLQDAELVSPIDAIVRSRILEPGEMASPQKPVLSLAVDRPKWVRAYVNERQLGLIRSGMAASVLVDSFPGTSFEGWLGFISPMAEFTPKPIQTEELRTSLVYEVRIFVPDPDDSLRLGMPVTVRIEPAGAR